jgi:asparagine synthase (glutamine-hydrolysing)
MCGIIGFISDRVIGRDNFSESRDLMYHRGPDDCGIWLSKDKKVALGHRRLSIIDLSSAGRQPMSNEDNSIWLVQNGEIYNFLEIRKELIERGHKFKSNSDSEVIIHSYEEWGVECLKKFNGMFAFALWDEKENRLFAARDRIGIKPFNYYFNGGKFAFSSEIKALKNLDKLNLELDYTAIYDFFTYLYVPTPKTVYKHIKKLPPGHYLLFDRENLVLKKYWDINPFNKRILSEKEACNQIEEILNDSVRLRLISDVPIGVFLSGGIDSSCVVALASKLVNKPLKTFSVGFNIKNHSEIKYARIVSDIFNTNHTERILNLYDAMNILPKIISNYDEPYADTSAFPTYIISKVAREEATVVLSGDGGDEVFGGYNWYEKYIKCNKIANKIGFLFTPFWRSIRSVCPGKMIGKATLDQISHSSIKRYVLLLNGLLKKEKFKYLTEEILSNIPYDYDDYWYFRKYWENDLDIFTRLQYLDLKTYLVDDILTKVDRASMLASLEVRVPLLDHRLVELAFSIDHSVRNKYCKKKYIFKKMLVKYLPETILNREKKGFSIPFFDWFGDKIQTGGIANQRFLRLNFLLGIWEKANKIRNE